jgi:hypothetical protein
MFHLLSFLITTDKNIEQKNKTKQKRIWFLIGAGLKPFVYLLVFAINPEYFSPTG